MVPSKPTLMFCVLPEEIEWLTFLLECQECVVLTGQERKFWKCIFGLWKFLPRKSSRAPMTMITVTASSLNAVTASIIFNVRLGYTAKGSLLHNRYIFRQWNGKKLEDLKDQETSPVVTCDQHYKQEQHHYTQQLISPLWGWLRALRVVKHCPEVLGKGQELNSSTQTPWNKILFIKIKGVILK